MQTQPAVALPDAARVEVRVGTLLQLGSLLLPLVVVAVLVQQYELENAVFQRLMTVTVAGFAVHALLPLRYRLPFFVLLSYAAILLSFGARDGGWLILTGLALIGICHLPVRYGARVALLLAAGVGLAAARGGMVAGPWGGAVWPILGSMFMFRLALYLHAMRHENARPRLSQSLAYFFMLPNVSFALFPIIDYSVFTRTYYDRAAFSIYLTGLRWIVRGVMHLVLYRLVYLYVVGDPADIFDLGDLMQFLLGTYLLYLRVSGQFHIIVGLLHLFGFRLPETHHLYYLASSFSDYWRRINIYWKDFMMKLVYYPTFFRVRRWGTSFALVAATVVVFAATWVLHSYQWFWLRGDFPMAAQDGLFWAALGALVVVNVIWETRRGRSRVRAHRGWSLSLGLRTLATFSIICVLWSLWSAESVTEWLWMWPAAAHVEPAHLLALLAVLAAGVVVGGYPWGVQGLGEEEDGRWTPRVALQVGATLAALVLLQLPQLQQLAPGQAREVLADLSRQGLNARESLQQHKGYYEQLNLRSQPGSPLVDVLDAKPDGWTDLAGTGMLRARADLLGRDLYPARRVSWNGRVLTTNQWGMRDRDYTVAKPEGTLRVALLGPSHTMGNNVSDGETFEALLEERLNRDAALGLNRPVEILNFGVDGYAIPQQLAMLEDRVLAFAPDVVIVTESDRARYTAEHYLMQTVVWGGAPVPYPELRELLAEAQLLDLDRNGTPVPFRRVRRLAERFGVDTRMPSSESAARLKGVGDVAVALSLQRVARLSRETGAVPVLLALNAVVEPPRIEPPMLRSAAAAGLLVLDLFDVYQGHDLARLQVAPWDAHPNAEGHRLIADRLYGEVQKHGELLGLPPAPRPAPASARLALVAH